METNRLRISIDENRVSMELQCRLGVAPTILQDLINNVLLPAATEHDSELLEAFASKYPDIFSNSGTNK